MAIVDVLSLTISWSWGHEQYLYALLPTLLPKHMDMQKYGCYVEMLCLYPFPPSAVLPGNENVLLFNNKIDQQAPLGFHHYFDT